MSPMKFCVLTAWVSFSPFLCAGFHQQMPSPFNQQHEFRGGLQALSMSVEGKSVLGLGSCGVDFVATVDKYPEADAKIRSTSFNVFGGGNVGNTLTCLSRLSVDARLVTKVGTDSNGGVILSGLEEEGVDTTRCLKSPDTDSAFTYVIVDPSSATRTCIHTPQKEEMKPEEITQSLLEGVDIVHLDSRHTPAAIKLAELAREKGVLITLDAEKDRPYFKELLPLCDILICNSKFPTIWTGCEDRLEAMAQILSSNDNAKMIISTIGEEGSIMVCKPSELEDTFLKIPTAAADSPLKVSTEVYLSEEISSSYEVFRCPAWPVEKSEIVDTTGAGDSFIGGVIFGVLSKMPAYQLLILASYIAAQKLKQPGARTGIPRLDQIPDSLLSSSIQ
mmetsp:Transcript_4755/g.6525  ORF Transcript_4755/g.6525 Transcript_4755/m.6525 type:complete len:390 (+) Transcript_4755:173-1342(+)